MAMLVAVVMMLGIVTLAGTAYAHIESIHEGMYEPTPQNRPPVPDVITWSILDEPPSYPLCYHGDCSIIENLSEPHDMARIILAIENALDIWKDHNPELNFEMVVEDGDIGVGLVVELRDATGLALRTGDYAGWIILDIGAYGCRGEYSERSSDSLTNIMMHETGHILGLKHTNENGHLMNGSDPVDPFDTLDYNIPDKLEEKGRFMGSDQIKARIDAISQEWFDLSVQYEYPRPPEVTKAMNLLNEREDFLYQALNCMAGYAYEDYGTLDQRVALLYDDVAILDAKLTSIQATLNTINTSIDAILDRLVALETGTSGSTPPTPEPEPEPEPTPSPTPEPEPTMGIIEGKIYNDSNNNDILDAGEPGIPNRTVLLTNYNDWTEILQITTDSNGDYFIELPAGSTWLVQVGGTGIFDYTTVQSGSATVVNLGLIFLSTE